MLFKDWMPSCLISAVQRIECAPTSSFNPHDKLKETETSSYS